MSHVDAVYRHGVFQPLEPVQLVEEQRVRLSIELAGAQAPPSWLNDVQKLQAEVLKRQGAFPDSTADIAADRLR